MSAPVQCPKCNGSGEMHHVEDGVTVAQQCSGCDGVGSLGTIQASREIARLTQAVLDEREATIDAVLRILNASERDYAWLRQRVRDERAK